MGRSTDMRQERTSSPAIQKAELRQPANPESRSPLATTRSEPRRRMISEDDVRLRAYELYLQRGAIPGNEVGDWLQAEQELRAN